MKFNENGEPSVDFQGAEALITKLFKRIDQEFTEDECWCAPSILLSVAIAMREARLGRTDAIIAFHGLAMYVNQATMDRIKREEDLGNIAEIP